MAEPLTIGLIGCGGMMGEHVKGFRQLWEHGVRNFRIVACCDTDRARAGKLADACAEFQSHKPQLYGDFEQMIAGEKNMDAVDISLVHRLHHTVAVACLDANKHVTIEKPIAITIRAARVMIDAARRRNRVLHVAENYRRSPAERAINWAIKEGRLGKLRMIFWVDVGERLWYWGWRDDVDQAGGGWSMDGGVHFADLFRYHVGEVAEMVAYSKAYHPVRYGKPDQLAEPIPATVEDTTMALMRFENGATGVWCSTMAAPGHAFRERAVYGETGSIKWDVGLQTRTEKLSMDELVQQHQSHIGREQLEQLFPRGITSTVAIELHEFIDSVINGTPVEIDGIEGMKDLALSLAIYESEVAGGPVAIPAVENGAIAEYQKRFDEPLGLR